MVTLKGKIQRRTRVSPLLRLTLISDMSSLAQVKTVCQSEEEGDTAFSRSRLPAQPCMGKAKHDGLLQLPGEMQQSFLVAPLAPNDHNKQPQKAHNVHSLATPQQSVPGPTHNAQCWTHCTAMRWPEQMSLLCEKVGNPAQHAQDPPRCST